MGLALSVTALVTVSLASAAWFHRLRRVAIPDRPLGFLSLWSLGVLLGATSLMSPGTGWTSGIIAVLAILGGAVMLAFYALGKQRAGNAIRVGDAIPVFSALDEHGQTFHSASLADTLTLIKFFRGHW